MVNNPYGYVGDKASFKAERKPVVQSIYQVDTTRGTWEKRDEEAINKLFSHGQILPPSSLKMIKSEPSTLHYHHNRGLRVMLREAHNNQ